MKQVMQEKGVRAASLTIGKNGKIVLSRGYTWAEPDYAITQPGTLFRLASVSKMFTSAAIYELLQANKVSATDKVFPMLGLTPLAGQTPDPQLKDITVQNLIDHKGGWDAKLAGNFDPVFASPQSQRHWVERVSDQAPDGSVHGRTEASIRAGQQSKSEKTRRAIHVDLIRTLLCDVGPGD